MSDNKIIVLNNVMLGGNSLFVPSAFEEGKEPKFSAVLVMGWEDAQYKMLQKEVDSQLEALFDGSVPKNAGSCIIDGDDRTAEYYHGKVTVSASNKYRPQILGRRKEVLVADDDVLFAGCNVNALISLWRNPGKKGKGVFANLHGIQFVSSGERKGGGGIDVSKYFQELSDDDLMS